MTAPTVCAECRAEVAPGLLACPSCQTLVFGGRLKELAREAQLAGDAGDRPTEMARWREALDLLPAHSRQHEAITAKLETLARTTSNGRPAPGPARAAGGSWLKRSAAVLVATAILLLTKGKFLLSGLLKLPTLLSMFAAFGVYWTIWGWRFALGIILTTYVHEMGHVAALVRYGVKASAPMFVPGLGAYVRMHQHVASVRQDARVGLAGPLWGLAAGLFCYAVGTLADQPAWLAIASVTGFINLFNLVPVWQLDGGRAFNSLATWDRWIAAGILFVAWSVSGQGLLLLIALVAGWQAYRKNAVDRDPGALALFGGLVFALTWLASVAVPGTQ
jgi:Zn-dependent protease